MILTKKSKSTWRRTCSSATLLSVLFAIIVIKANKTKIIALCTGNRSKCKDIVDILLGF